QPLVPEVQTKGCEAEDALVPHSAPPVPRRATPRTDRARTGPVPRSRSGGTPRTIAGKSQTNLKTFLGDFRKRSCYVRVGMFRWSTRNVNSGAIREVLSCACQTLHGQAVHRSVRRKPPIYA